MLAEDGEDAELRQMVAEAPEQLRGLEDELRLAMVERDPNDDKNVIVEIRAGAGGDEAALFAGDLFNMLTRYAEERGFKTEVLSQSAAEVGGFKEVTFEIKGDGAYSVFKFEGGTHRVQRVPKTESQGRIHTSTATVAVLPEAEEVDVEIDPNDLKIDVYRSSGPGGQSVNTTDSAVRITHGPTGIVVSMQDEKSQLQNRDKAMRVLRARLYERALDEQQAEIAAERKSQVGTGQRSEKVRTYNFPQGRVTDHRIKLTAHNLDEILAGDLGEFTEALAAEEKRARLEAQTDRRRMSAAVAGTTGEALRAAVDALAAAGVDSPRLDAELLLAEATGPQPGRAGRVARARGRGARRARVRRDGAAAGAARAGRLHPRPPRLSPDRARRRPAGADPAARDRAAGRAGARGRAARRCSTSAPGPARSRSPSPTSCPARRWSPPTPRSTRSWSRRPTPSGSVSPCGSSWARCASGPFDLVLANLPYVPEDEYARARARDHRVRARGALTPGPTGLEAIDALLGALAPPRRLPAAIGLEVGEGQAATVAELVRRAGFERVEVRRDLAGIERVVVGWA